MPLAKIADLGHDAAGHIPQKISSLFPKTISEFLIHSMFDLATL